MKKIGLFLFTLFLFMGCMNLPTYTYSPFINQSIDQGQEKNAGIGDIFFEFSEGQTATEPTYAPTGMVISGFKFDLTIVELNQERIGLQYNEFTYPPGAFVGLRYFPGGGWIVKQGFNKRFDYVLADKIIRFKGYEFEIILIENGQIKYRRVK